MGEIERGYQSRKTRQVILFLTEITVFHTIEIYLKKTWQQIKTFSWKIVNLKVYIHVYIYPQTLNL